MIICCIIFLITKVTLLDNYKSLKLHLKLVNEIKKKKMEQKHVLLSCHV